MDILRGGWAPGLLGNGAGLRADSPSTGGYSTEAQAIFTAFTTPPSTARKNLIDAAVVALKAGGVWNKLDALYLYAAADSQAAKVNWKAPGTFNCAEVNAPAFAVDQGFTGASTKYLDTGFNPTTATTPKFTQNDASVFGWSTTNLDSDGGIVGTSVLSGNEVTFLPRFSGQAYGFVNDPTGAWANTDSSGYFCVTRRAASGAGAKEAYRNTTSLGTSTQASGAPASAVFRFLARFTYFFAGQMAAGGFGSQLSAAENTTLYNALSTYLTNISLSGYQTESEAIFAAFTTPPTTPRKDLIDACVVSLKSAGVWTKLDALYLFAAADSQAAKVNWKAPGTFNATEVNAPTFTANSGFTGASTKYLDTGFNPTTAPSPKYVQDSASAFGWSVTNTDQAAGIVGNSVGSGNELVIYPRFSNQLYGFVNDGVGAWANTDGSGLLTVTRRTAAAKEAYRNTTSVGTSTQASGAVLSATFQFMARASTYWTGTVAGGGFGSQLSAAEVTALYNALRTYMTGVGVP